MKNFKVRESTLFRLSAMTEGQPVEDIFNYGQIFEICFEIK